MNETERIFHPTDPTQVRHRLCGFYGQVADRQNRFILDAISGTTVLDIGSGYGHLLNTLNKNKFEAVGLEPAAKEIEYSRLWYGVTVQQGSLYDAPFSDSQFDTTILRDAIFHFDLDRAIPELKRITAQRLLVFMGNSGPLLRFSKWLLGHQEYNMKTADDYIHIFDRAGFSLVRIQYLDFFAFPLSGGYIGIPLVPHSKSIWRLLLFIENQVDRILTVVGLKKLFAFRVLLAFDKKPDPEADDLAPPKDKT